MMNKFSGVIKKTCAVSLAACMLAGGGAATVGSYVTEGIVASAAGVTIVESGKCGDNVNYTLDSKGTLTISGIGKIYYDSPFKDKFNTRPDISRIVIEDGITNIDCSFFDCYNIESIEIPESVINISSCAFMYCTGLINVNEKNKNYSSVNGILFDTNKTKIIRFPLRNDEITDEIKYYKVPDSVTNIDSYAFYNSPLTSIEFSNSVQFIGEGAFWDCSSLTNIEIPNSVTSIGEYAFDDCSSLTNIVIPNSVESIGDDAFGGCSSLKDVYYSGTEEEWKKNKYRFL